MDVHAHQPGEELADFTESELLSLIDAGTAGAYSEIYRRYCDDAVAKASSSLPEAKARQVTDDAFLTVLRSLLNRSADTAEGLRYMVDAEIDTRLANSTTADPTSANSSDSFGDASSADSEAPEAAQVSQALSALPDNWQRILWLREVERLPPEAVAKQLNIKASAVGRLADRAHQGLRDEWRKVRPADSQATADHRAALIPALLTSPIVIERLSNALAQAQPESAPAVADTAVTNTAAVEEPAGTKHEAETTMAEGTDVAGRAAGAKDEDTTTAVLPSIVAAAGAGTVIGNAPALNPAAGAETTPETEAEPGAHTAPEATPAADSAGATAGTAGDTNTVEPVSLAAFGAQSAATQTSTRAPAATRFSMPKPVLIPVVAACIGLLGTLVGVAIVPQNDEQAGLRPGTGSTAVSPADSSSKKEDKNSSSQSPAGTNSDKQDQESGSEKSKASGSDRDEDEKSSRSPGHDDSPSDDSSSTEDKPGDTGDKSNKGDSNDRPSAEEPDNPSPSDSDEPDTESPSEPEPTTPGEPDEPSDEPPSETEDPEPTEPPATEPPPSDEPTTPTEEPPEEPSPSDPPPSDTEAPSDADATQGGSSSAPSTSN